MEKKSKKERYANHKKTVIAGSILLIAAACVLFAWLMFRNDEQAVRFEHVKESQMPEEIASDVLPEYRTLERALACSVDEKIYVIVTRGEKPSSGFGADIEKMILEDKEGKKNLIVYAAFDDPEKETAISQIITYPAAVARTDLKTLPDTIELRIQY